MSAKIIETVTRPSLDHMFFQEWRLGLIYKISDIPNDDTELYVNPLTRTWLEEISIEEIALRKNELRPDWVATLFNQDVLIIDSSIYFPVVNPFSLTDTIIRTYSSESDMRNSKRLLKSTKNTIFAYSS